MTFKLESNLQLFRCVAISFLEKLSSKTPIVFHIRDLAQTTIDCEQSPLSRKTLKTSMLASVTHDGRDVRAAM